MCLQLLGRSVVCGGAEREQKRVAASEQYVDNELRLRQPQAVQHYDDHHHRDRGQRSSVSSPLCKKQRNNKRGIIRG